MKKKIEDEREKKRQDEKEERRWKRGEMKRGEQIPKKCFKTLKPAR